MVRLLVLKVLVLLLVLELLLLPLLVFKVLLVVGSKPHLFSQLGSKPIVLGCEVLVLKVQLLLDCCMCCSCGGCFCFCFCQGFCGSHRCC